MPGLSVGGGSAGSCRRGASGSGGPGGVEALAVAVDGVGHGSVAVDDGGVDAGGVEAGEQLGGDVFVAEAALGLRGGRGGEQGGEQGDEAGGGDGDEQAGERICGVRVLHGFSSRRRRPCYYTRRA